MDYTTYGSTSIASSLWRRWGLILLGLGIVGALLYYYAAPSKGKQVSAMFTGPQSLKGETSILKQADAELFYASPEGTIQAFFYVNTVNRTGHYAPCGTGAGQASCADGTFGPCPCGGSALNDCSQCKHIGYENLFSVADVLRFEVLTVPDASRQGKAMAQITIKTVGPRPTSASASAGGTQTYIETIPLPQIPMQKWIMLTISREGRRFDIYYDKALVVSKKTLYMPVTSTIDTNMRGVLSGSDSLAGEVALLDVESRRYTMGEIAVAYVRKSDTRGTPYVSSEFTAGYRDQAGLLPNYSDSLFGTFRAAIPSVNPCPSGKCLDMPAVKPASPIYDWSTSYA